jgi:hypothetical protein
VNYDFLHTFEGDLNLNSHVDLEIEYSDRWSRIQLNTDTLPIFQFRFRDVPESAELPEQCLVVRESFASMRARRQLRTEIQDHTGKPCGMLYGFRQAWLEHRSKSCFKLLRVSGTGLPREWWGNRTEIDPRRIVAIMLVEQKVLSHGSSYERIGIGHINMDTVYHRDVTREGVIIE